MGTSAPRRIAQLSASHPHLTIVPVRGNADTRLALAYAGEVVDAVILANAGLRRIGREPGATQILGAGQLDMQMQGDDAATLAPLADARATRAALAERSLLRALAGHCHAPIAGHASAEKSGEVHLVGRVYAADGSFMLSSELTDSTPEAVGRAVAGDLISQGATVPGEGLHGRSDPGIVEGAVGVV